MKLFSRKAFDFLKVQKLLNENKIVTLAGSGDPHESYGRVDLLKRMVSKLDYDYLIFDGDYLEEPAYLKVGKEKETAKDAVTKLKNLFKTLEDVEKPVLFTGGNYEILGTVWDAIDDLGNDLFVNIGCDKLREKLIDHVFKSEVYMEISTVHETWPGNTFQHKKGNLIFLGVEGTNIINYTFPGERTESNIKWAIEEGLSERDIEYSNLILLTHVPPFGTRDQLGRFGVPPHMWGARKGSTALRDFLDSKKPLMIISGHIHENFGLFLIVEKNGARKTFNIDFKDRTKLLVAYDKNNTNVSLVLNKGTLENWNWSVVTISEIENYRLIDIEGEWLTKSGVKKQFKKYNKILDFDNVLNYFI